MSRDKKKNGVTDFMHDKTLTTHFISNMKHSYYLSVNTAIIYTNL